MNEFNYWKLLAGLGVFMLGMQLLEQSVKDIGGKSLRKIIRRYTNTRLKAIGNGALITALLQSSSAVSLMVLAFVGAGIMSMENAIGVILGSNIGTTLTAWIVATLGFKVKIETFALPFIGIGAIGLIAFKQHSKPYHVNRLLIGFGLLFLGLDYMKTSVEAFSTHIDPNAFQDLALWMYLAAGALITALMQASAATIAIILTALNSQLMTFEMGAAMVIGANIGTTITILLGAIGGTLSKKRVAASHLIFNVLTGAIAFAALPFLIVIVKTFVDISNEGPVGLALFHTLFNVTGVILFFPLIPLLTKLLEKILPEYKPVLCIYLPNTPPEEVEIASVALKNEVSHLLQESQLYMIRSLQMDERLFFDEILPFEKSRKRKLSLSELYNTLRLLNSDIISYYSKIQLNKVDEEKTKELERIILASRNIMNAAKNFNGIHPDLEELEASEYTYLNHQYANFKRRMIAFSHGISQVFSSDDPEQQYQKIMEVFGHVENADNSFIQNTIKAASLNQIQAEDLANLLLVNRLFTQACRMLIYSLKDLSLPLDKKIVFDRAANL